MLLEQQIVTSFNVKRRGRVIIIYFSKLTLLDAKIFIKNTIALCAAHLIERGS